MGSSLKYIAVLYFVFVGALYLFVFENVYYRPTHPPISWHFKMDSFFKTFVPPACVLVSWLLSRENTAAAFLLLLLPVQSHNTNHSIFLRSTFCNSFGVASLSALCTARHQSHPFLRNMPWLTRNIAPTYFVFVCERVYYSLSDTLTDSLDCAVATERLNTSLLVVFPAPPLLISLSGISGCFLRGWFVRGRNLENQQRAAAAWQPLDPAHCALMHPMNIRTILEEVAFWK